MPKIKDAFNINLFLMATFGIASVLFWCAETFIISYICTALYAVFCLFVMHNLFRMNEEIKQRYNNIKDMNDRMNKIYHRD